MTTRYGQSNSDQLYFKEDHQMLRKTVADFISNEINPSMDQWEEEGQAPLHELFKKMGDLGLLEIRYDPEWGGQGLDNWLTRTLSRATTGTAGCCPSGAAPTRS